MPTKGGPFCLRKLKENEEEGGVAAMMDAAHSSSKNA
jgi:hypothetical protein